MKRVLLLVWLIASGIAIAQTVQRSVVSSGAVRASSGSVVMQGTIGQPIIGSGVNTEHRAGHGFWHTLVSSVSSVERTDPFQVRITPQPAVTVATIEVGCTHAVSAEVLTLQGQQVGAVRFSSDAAMQRGQLDCSTLASGLYLVRLRCGEQQLFLPLMIAK
ncbi:MAG: hypothetical protein KatS3mg039_0241 [Candidatus Kapaibacterium sp.]|nr:MAG: hypothetical protein KatS3mg039_0241 [Candidatus Kapabacteria bacterium]